eukprot:607265-Pyramimonas_sp.AAC.1
MARCPAPAPRAGEAEAVRCRRSASHNAMPINKHGQWQVRVRCGRRALTARMKGKLSESGRAAPR